jgi:hypothetical protein
MNEVDMIELPDDTAVEAAAIGRRAARRAMARAARQAKIDLAREAESQDRPSRRAARQAAREAARAAAIEVMTEQDKPRRKGRRLVFFFGLGLVAAGVAYAIRMKRQAAQVDEPVAPTTRPASVPRADGLPSNGTAPQPRQEEMKGHVSNPN